jgi:predicted PurR-regulated permease PerM
VIQGVLTTIGFYLFGIQHAVLWGSIAAVAALVPGFGTSIVVVPGIIFLFLSGSTNPAIGLTIWSVVIIGLVDNFLMPTFVGKKFQAHPMLILFGVLGGIFLFGPIGVFMGPLVIALLLALIDIYKLLLVGRDGFTNKI